MTGPEKCKLLIQVTALLIKVIAWAGLTVFNNDKPEALRS
jgi:hypothetical protein